jgi:Zn-dependent M28 family amino/carboxypeptidase
MKAMRPRWASIAALVLLAGCLAQPDAKPSSPAVAMADPPAIDIDRFLHDYQAFVTTYPDRAGNVATHLGARQDIVQRLAGAGLDVWREDFTDGGMDQANLIGVHWGLDRTHWLVVGAHYDDAANDCGVAAQTNQPAACVGRKATQGAYDNGSGTALTMELARTLSNNTSNLTVAFALFDGEERGLQGSRAFVQDLLDGDTPWGEVTVDMMLNSDMFGLTWPGVGAPIHFYDDTGRMKGAVEEARLALGVPDDRIVYGNDIPPGASDDGPFLAANIETGAFDSDFSYVDGPNGLLVGRQLPGAYPFFHVADTWDSMALAAGGPDHVRSGFTTALGLETRVVWTLGGFASAAADSPQD